jgi:hypothetical protein
MAIRSRCAAIAFLAAFAAASAAQPFGPSGTEFRVNTTTTGNQQLPAVGIDSSGAFVVAWKAGRNDLFAQRYSSSGAPLGGEFRVNTSVGYPYFPAVSGAASGLFRVVWAGSVINEPTSVFGRRYTGGSGEGDDFRVSTTTGFYEKLPDVATDSSGNFVVVWGRAPTSTISFDVYGQRFSSAGAKLGGEFLVNAASNTRNAGAPSVASSASGAFVVAWTPNTFPADVGRVFWQRYDSSGAPLGGIGLASSDTSNGGAPPAVASAPSGDFILAWGGSYVWARRYSSAGTSLGDIFRVDTTSEQIPPHKTSVATDAAGNFVVVWEFNDQGTYEIFARRFASAGAPLGGQFRVNVTSTGKPRLGNVAMSSAGNFVVTWHRGDYPSYDVYARRYCATLAGDANGDGAISILDVFHLINTLFAGGPQPVGASDANGDGVVSVLDVFHLINALFASGPGPACA